MLLDGESVKSCTVLAVQADGAEVTTIEGLATDGELHPVQQAFHESHGLQCGYCTPGLVMAAVSLLEENPNPSEEEIRLGLEGNLCRCTGYHNIVKAVPPAAKARSVIPAAFDYARAGSVDEAIELLGREDAKLIAGGHSLHPADAAALRAAVAARGHRPPEELSYVRDDGDRIAIGALTRHADLARDLLAQAAPSLAGRPARSATRRSATAGRSAARSPTATRPPTRAVLLALDADFVARGPSGERTIPATDSSRPVRDRARPAGGAQRDPRAEGGPAART